MSTRKTCGSELARDDGFTFNISVDCHTAIASKLAPTNVPSIEKDVTERGDDD